MAGLPIQLHDGRISSVTARIPWPNPLTSTIRLSLQSLHLTFCLNPPISESSLPHSVNLAESVATVAESFIHDELTPREEAALRESFHPDLASRSPQHEILSVPGSMDPFLSDSENEEYHGDADPDGISIFATLFERLLARFEFDALDTKITLIHPSHTRFTFSIADIKYGTEVKDPSTAAGVQTGSNPSMNFAVRPGETRTVSISGVRISALSMRSTRISSRSQTLSPSTFSPVTSGSPPQTYSGELSPILPRPASPTSSSSSLDEETQFLMSQSIVSLPPRASSPASSMESSMYESAVGGSIYESVISIAQGDRTSVDNSNDATTIEGSRCASRTPSPGPGQRADSSPSESHKELPPSNTTNTDVGNDPREENDVILSLGSEAVVIRLTTPSPNPLSPLTPSDSPSTIPQTSGTPQHADQEGPLSKDKEKLQLSVTIGIVACSLRAWHIRSLLDALRVLNLQPTPPPPPPQLIPLADPTPKFGFELEATAKMRGIVILFLPSSLITDHRSSDAMSSYFAHPLLPPKLAHGYVRLFIDNVAARVSADTSTLLPGSETQAHAAKSPHTTGLKVTTVLSTSLSDLSAFAFLPPGSDQRDTGPSASPILITDQHLTSQYPRNHIHLATGTASELSGLPTFDVIDWTDRAHRTSSPKISLWRTKMKSKQSSADVIPAVSANVTRKGAEKEQWAKSSVVEVNLVPVHVFVDLGLALGEGSPLLEYLAEIMEPREVPAHEAQSNGSDSEDHKDSSEDERGETPLATPRLSARNRRNEKERDRLEKLVIADLDLGLDYTGNDPLKPSRLRGKQPDVPAKTPRKASSRYTYLATRS
jgi:autophagy-related protein 2